MFVADRETAYAMRYLEEDEGAAAREPFKVRRLV